MVSRIAGKTGDKVIDSITRITYDEKRRANTKKNMSKTFYNLSREDMDKKFSI